MASNGLQWTPLILLLTFASITFLQSQTSPPIATKLTNFPNILQEFDYKFEKDLNTGKLMFLEDYLKTNNIKPNSYRS